HRSNFPSITKSIIDRVAYGVLRYFPLPVRLGQFAEVVKRETECRSNRLCSPYTNSLCKRRLGRITFHFYLLQLGPQFGGVSQVSDLLCLDRRDGAPGTIPFFERFNFGPQLLVFGL